MDIDKFLNDVIRLEPEQNALEFKKHWYTWGDVSAMVDKVNEILDSAGVTPGAGVGVLLRNRPAHFGTMLALLITRRPIVLVNHMQPLDRIKEDLRKLRTEALIMDTEEWAEDGMKEVAAEIGCVSICLGGENYTDVAPLPGCEKLGPGPFLEPMPDVVVQMLTSGTTGTPKRIPLAYKTFQCALTDAIPYEKGRSVEDPPQLREGVTLLPMPFTHMSGLFGAVSNVLAGRAICLLERFTVEGWHDGIKRHRPRVANAVPTALRMILDANIPKEDLSSLVAIRSGSAPLPPETVDEVMERYGIPVLGNYGATEFAGGVAGWNYRDFKQHWTEKRGSVGKMQAGVEARIVDQETSAPLATNEPGLLELRGKQLGDPSKWLQTTDLARLDEDGFLFILGRADNAIIRGGFKVSPGDLSKTLESHPAIREAAVVGIDDKRLGQVPVAAITLEPGADAPEETELEQLVREKMTAYSVPAEFLFVDELPLTRSMKVSAADVKALFEKASSSQA